MKYSLNEYLIKILERLKLKKKVGVIIDNFNKPKKFNLNRKIKTITIDTTLYESELCYFGKEFDSDKSPLNFKSKSRHSYTGVYNLLFSGFKNNQVKIAEFGVLGNASIKMWSSFHNVEIFAFDNDINFVNKAKNEKIKNVNYYITDVRNKTKLKSTMNEINQKFDIVIDDSNHIFESQMNIVEICKNFIKPNGYLIIEDIYTSKKAHEEKRYLEKLDSFKGDFKDIFFIVCKHKNNYTKFFPNHKLLVLKK